MREKYESLSLAVLKELAKARGLKGISTLRKGQLIEVMLEQDEKDKAAAEQNAAMGLDMPLNNAEEVPQNTEEPAKRRGRKKKAITANEGLAHKQEEAGENGQVSLAEEDPGIQEVNRAENFSSAEENTTAAVDLEKGRTAQGENLASDASQDMTARSAEQYESAISDAAESDTEDTGGRAAGNTGEPAGNPQETPRTEPRYYRNTRTPGYYDDQGRNNQRRGRTSDGTSRSSYDYNGQERRTYDRSRSRGDQNQTSDYRRSYQNGGTTNRRSYGNQSNSTDYRRNYSGQYTGSDNRRSYGNSYNGADNRRSYSDSYGAQDTRRSYGEQNGAQDTRRSYGEQNGAQDTRRSYGEPNGAQDNRRSYGEENGAQDTRRAYSDPYGSSENRSYGSLNSSSDARSGYTEQTEMTENRNYYDGKNEPVEGENGYTGQSGRNDNRQFYDDRDDVNENRQSYGNTMGRSDNRQSYGEQGESDENRQPYNGSGDGADNQNVFGEADDGFSSNGSYVEQNRISESRTGYSNPNDSSASDTGAGAQQSAADLDRPPAELSQLDSGQSVSGILEVMPDGYGFIRSDNYLPGENDVYVSPSQIRRFNLKTGDIISGNTRIKSQQEKFSALLYLKKINDLTPSEAMKRYNFEDMTPIFPNERLRMERDPKATAMRIVDLFSPIGKGQRGMIVSPPKAGKTTLLKDIARSLLANSPNMRILILLIDERPEEVTDIKEAIRGDNVEVIYSTFDETPEHHKRVSEMVIERAKRLVELKQDVTILLDSITRLARAYNLTVPPSGRTLSGGLDPAALHMPKRFFGAARNMREGGSLTILATALVDTGSKMDDVVYEEFKGTGNMELVLDRKLSEKRVFPAIDIPKSGTRREDLLLDREEQEAMYIMRRALNGMKSDEAVENIMNMFVHTRDNRELVQRVRRQKFI